MTGNFGNGAKMRRLTIQVGLALLCVLGAYATPAFGQRSNRTSNGERTTALFQDTTYVVKTGDVLRVRIWDYPEPGDNVEGDFPVERSGEVTLPLVGTVPVANMRVRDVQAAIRKRYEREQRSPTVLVVPVFAVAVMGEVGSPGVIEVYPSYTVFDAISLSGGFNDYARRKDVLVIRNGKTISIKGSSADDAAQRMADTPLESGDRIIVRRNGFAGAQLVSMVLNVVISTVTLVTVLTR